MDYYKRPDFNRRLLGGSGALEPPKRFQLYNFRSRNCSSRNVVSSTAHHNGSAIGAHCLSFGSHGLRASSTSVLRVLGKITELLVLAYNSDPASTALRNVSAGIKCMKTYRRVFIIRLANLARSRGGKLDSNHKQAKFFLLADGGLKADPVEDIRGRYMATDAFATDVEY